MDFRPLWIGIKKKVFSKHLCFSEHTCPISGVRHSVTVQVSRVIEEIVEEPPVSKEHDEFAVPCGKRPFVHGGIVSVPCAGRAKKPGNLWLGNVCSEISKLYDLYD